MSLDDDPYEGPEFGDPNSSPGPYNVPPGFDAEIAGPGEYPNPGGYLETTIFGQKTWHHLTPGGKDLYGAEAQAEHDKHELGGG